MKKPTKRDTINLFFSAFLIIAFIVCAHFFSQYASALSQPLGSIIPILVYAVFGLLMFYVLGAPVAAINTGMANFLTGLSGTNAVLLGLVIGLMMAFDMAYSLPS